MDAATRQNASNEPRALLVIGGGRAGQKPEGQAPLIELAAEPQSGDPLDTVLVAIGHHSNAPDLAFGREAFSAVECLFAIDAVDTKSGVFAAEADALTALEAHSLAAEVYLTPECAQYGLAETPACQPVDCECHQTAP